MNAAKAILLCAAVAVAAGCGRRADTETVAYAEAVDTGGVQSVAETNLPPRVTLAEFFRSKRMSHMFEKQHVIVPLNGHPGWEDAFFIAPHPWWGGGINKAVYFRLDETGGVHALAESESSNNSLVLPEKTLGLHVNQGEPGNDLFFDLDGDGIEELLVQRIRGFGGHPWVEIYRRSGGETEICDFWNVWKAVFPAFDIDVQEANYSFGTVLVDVDSLGSAKDRFGMFGDKPAFVYGNRDYSSWECCWSPLVEFHCDVKVNDALNALLRAVRLPWRMGELPDRTVQCHAGTNPWLRRLPTNLGGTVQYHAATELFGLPFTYVPCHPPRDFFE